MTDLVQLQNVGLSVRSGSQQLPLLNNVTFSVTAGESFGLVGESGSGKSMTLRTIARLLPAGSEVTGTLRFGGDDVTALTGAALREFRARGVGVIFQDARAAIDPLQRIGHFLIEPAIVRGERTQRQALGEAEQMLADVGIDNPRGRLGQYPLQLSGGMLQRVMIASVLLTRPQLILADEPTTALDVTTQSDVLAVLDTLRREAGTTLIFVTHNLDLAAAICDRIAVMYAGTIQEIRPASALVTEPLHPYTSALLGARPDITRRHGRLAAIPGRPVAAFEAPPGCVFSPRCGHANVSCHTTRPAIIAVPDGMVRCRRLRELHPATMSSDVPA